MKRKAHSIYLTLIALLALAVVRASPPGACAQSPNRAGLVVRFGDGSLITRCVEFSEPQISGYDVLMRSGLNVVAAYYSGEGAAICKIEHEGCSVEDCLTCAYPNYWSYWHLMNGAWVYSQAGAGGYTVHSGDVEGWSWGGGESPSLVPFDQICAPPPTDTPPPTAPPPPTDTPPPPTATSPPPTPVVWFRLDENPIPVGTCTGVRWDTSNALEVYLDEVRVDSSSILEVCPTEPQEYHLRVVSAVGEQIHTLVLGVTGTLPSPTFTPCPTSDVIATPTLAPTPCPTSNVTATPTLTPTQYPTRRPATTTPVATASQPVTASPQPVAQVTTPTSAKRQPTNQLTNQPTNQPTNQLTNQPTIPTGYAVFGVIVVGLLGWLVFGILRQR